MHNKVNRPNLFIVGAPKCGSTSLHFYLQQHPELFMSELKEINHFNFDMSTHVHYTDEEYLRHFATDKQYKYYGESTPYYMSSDVAMPAIKNFSPNSKIIIILRSPVDQVNSAYYHARYAAYDSAETLEKALEETEARRAIASKRVQRQNLEYGCYLDFPVHSPRIKYCQEIFGKENVHFILLDDLKSEPNAAIKKIFEFLNLADCDYAINFDPQNESRTNRSQVFKKLLRKQPKALKNVVKTLIPNQEKRQKLFKKMNNLNTDFGKKAPGLKPETRQSLQDHFSEEILALEQLLNRDLSHWK